MGMVKLDEAKTYLRVDSVMEDTLIGGLLLTAEKLSADVGRLTAEEWNTLCDPETETMTVRGTELNAAETAQLKALMKTAVLFTLGYLFEHREEADHHGLMMTLRNLLSAVREGVF